jgi:hypothetical protein
MRCRSSAGPSGPDCRRMSLRAVLSPRRTCHVFTISTTCPAARAARIALFACFQAGDPRARHRDTVGWATSPRFGRTVLFCGVLAERMVPGGILKRSIIDVSTCCRRLSHFLDYRTLGELWVFPWRLILTPQADNPAGAMAQQSRGRLKIDKVALQRGEWGETSSSSSASVVLVSWFQSPAEAQPKRKPAAQRADKVQAATRASRKRA